MIYKMDSKFKFLSLNVGSRSNLGGLVAILSDHKPDIIFLQEVKISSEEIALVARISNGVCPLLSTESRSARRESRILIASTLGFECLAT